MPPREIMEGALPAPAKRTLDEQGRRSATLAAHFGYGAATGALYALLRPRGIILPGAAYGLLVWTVSYFGIMPGLRILQPAHNSSAAPQLAHDRGSCGLGQHDGNDAAGTGARSAGGFGE